MSHDTASIGLAYTIAASYLLLAVIAGVQVVATICYGHKIRSFRVGFLALAFLWSLLRVLYYLVADEYKWSRGALLTLYCLPNACQIATFSLLVLFYAKLVHLHKWRERRRAYTLFYALVNSFLIIVNVCYAVLVQTAYDKNHNEADQPGLDELYFVSSAVFYATLIALAAHFLRILARQRRTQAGLSGTEILLNVLVFAIFSSRCVLELLRAFGITVIDYDIRQTDASDRAPRKMLTVGGFCLLFLWEIVPTLMVTGFYGSLPTLASGSSWILGMRSRCLCPCCTPPKRPMEERVSEVRSVGDDGEEPPWLVPEEPPCFVAAPPPAIPVLPQLAAAPPLPALPPPLCAVGSSYGTRYRPPLGVGTSPMVATPPLSLSATASASPTGAGTPNVLLMMQQPSLHTRVAQLDELATRASPQLPLPPQPLSDAHRTSFQPIVLRL